MYLIEEGKIRLPFTSLKGLGVAAAQGLAEAGKEGPYLSVDEISTRSGATKAIIEHEKATGKRHTPIVAMTANAFNEDRATALDAGMDDFMTKPISVRLLREILQKYLG